MDRQEALKELRAKIDEVIEFAANNGLHSHCAMLCTIQGASFNPLTLKGLEVLMYGFTKAQLTKEPSAN